ncbi:MAG: phosphoenolpyruvate hydrolase family protein, partial [Planctomycetaceae bacterium]
MSFTRARVLHRLHSLMDAGIPIVGGGAGTGISAKFEEAGGIDLIIIYNSGRYRMAGRGSRPAGFASPFVSGPFPAGFWSRPGFVAGGLSICQQLFPRRIR